MTLPKPLLLVLSVLPAVICVGGHAAAERWAMVAQTEKVTVYVDAQSISNRDGFRRAWEKWEYAEDRSPPPLTSVLRPFRSARFLMSFDCKERATAELQAIYYDAGGNVLGKLAGDPKNTAFTYVVPGLLGEAALDFVCKGKPRAPR